MNDAAKAALAVVQAAYAATFRIIIEAIDDDEARERAFRIERDLSYLGAALARHRVTTPKERR